MVTGSAMTYALNMALEDVPECIGVGCIDAGSGVLLGFKTTDANPYDLIELLGPATADMYQGRVVTQIETHWSKMRGFEGVRHYFQEIIIGADDMLFIFMRSRRYQDYVALFVWRNMSNLGMALSKARGAMPYIERAL
jgi:hypothetical protein